MTFLASENGKLIYVKAANHKTWNFIYILEAKYVWGIN